MKLFIGSSLYFLHTSDRPTSTYLSAPFFDLLEPGHDEHLSFVLC